MISSHFTCLPHVPRKNKLSIPRSTVPAVTWFWKISELFPYRSLGKTLNLLAMGSYLLAAFPGLVHVVETRGVGRVRARPSRSPASPRVVVLGLKQLPRSLDAGREGSEAATASAKQMDTWSIVPKRSKKQKHPVGSLLQRQNHIQLAI